MAETIPDKERSLIEGIVVQHPKVGDRFPLGNILGTRLKGQKDLLFTRITPVKSYRGITFLSALLRRAILYSGKPAENLAEISYQGRLGYSSTTMPPKSIPPAARQAALLSHLRSTRTCHTLRDLEKTIPAAIPSINGMQVKEYLQALIDEGTLRVEKIGSGNWYWSFGSEGRKEREVIRERLEKDLEKVFKGTRDIEEKVEEAKRAMRVDEGEGGDAQERSDLITKQEELEVEVGKLRAEEEGFRSAGSGRVQRMKEEIVTWKGETELWTDNIYILEEYLRKLAGGDREIVEAVRRECYGDEYVEGEGLREL